MTSLTKTEVAILVAVTPIAVIVYPFRWMAWACKSKYKKGTRPGLFVIVLIALLAGCTTNSGPVTHSDPAWIFAKEGVTK